MGSVDFDDEKKREKKKFKSYPIGYFHIDITEVRTEEGKLYLFVAVDPQANLFTSSYRKNKGKCRLRDFCGT
jgi:hypothetical protein